MTETTANTPPKSPAGAGSEILPPAGDAAPPPSGKPDRVTAVSNLALGSLLMALDALDGWVDRNVPTEAQALDQRAKGTGRPAGRAAAPIRMGRDLRPAGDRSHASCRDGPGRYCQRAGRAGDAVRLADRRPGRGGRALAAGPHLPVQAVALWDRSCGGSQEPADRPVGRGGKGAGQREPRRRRGLAGSRSPGYRGGRDRRTPRPGARPGDRRRARVRASPRRSSRRCASTLSRWIWAWTGRGRPCAGGPNPNIALPDFAVAIRDKKPDPKEMAGRPYLGGAYAGIASRVLAFAIDVFALIIALIITFVFVWAVSLDLQPGPMVPVRVGHTRLWRVTHGGVGHDGSP